MNRSPIGTIAAFILLAVLIAGVWQGFARRESRLGLPPAGISDTAPRFPADEAATSQEPDDLMLEIRASPDGVRASQQGTLPCQVLGHDGTPLGGVHVSWTPFEDAWLARAAVWPDMDWEAIDRATVHASTDAEGRFSLEQASHSSTLSESVIWFTYPDHLGRFVLLGSGAGLPPVVRLEHSGRLLAHVRDGNGMPVGGATIVESIYLGRDDPTLGEGKELDAKRILRRSWTTGADGRAVLHPLPGTLWVHAELEGLRSEPWSGEVPAEVDLVLAPTFAAQGRVILEPGAELEHDLSVRCSIRRGFDYPTVDRVAVRPDATWGPVNLPVIAGDVWRFQLEGGSSELETVDVPIPRTGDRISADFHPRPGMELSVRVVGEDDKDLVGANVSVQWNIDGVWRELARKTGKDGIAHCRGVRPGTLWIRARRTGYALNRIDALEVASSPPEPLTLRLDPAGRIEGRCVHRGAPVRDFDVEFWTEPIKTTTRKRVHGSQDGVFVLEEVPLGEVLLFASSEEWPKSETKRVVVSREEAERVEIELPDALLGRGRVIDALSGDPLPNASVTIHACHQGTRIRPWKAAFPVDSRGAFEIAGFVVGENQIEVTAPGHAMRADITWARAGEAIEFGTIGLHAKQSLEVQLMFEGDHDFSKSYAELKGDALLGPKTFSREGHLNFEGLDPGFYALRVYLVDYGVMTDVGVDLAPGNRHRVELPVGRGNLAVRVVPEPGLPIPHGCALSASFRRADGSQIRQVHNVPGNGIVPGDGRVELLRVEGESVLLEVSDMDSSLLGTARYPLGSTTAPVLEVRVDTAPRRVRVVDSHRRPFPGVKVTVTCEEDPTGWIIAFSTDETGEFDLKGVTFHAVRAMLFHPDVGVTPSLLIDLGSGKPVPDEIVLAPDAVLRVRMLESGHAAANLEAWAGDAKNGIAIASQTRFSDPDGLASWSPVARGDYIVRVVHPGYWRSERMVRVGTDPDPAPMQVRRLGSIEVQVKDAYDVEREGVAVDLLSVEQQAWASNWIEHGLVPAPPHGLVTDEHGRLRVNGLPNGPFRWRATAPGGSPVEGEVTVPPQAVGSIAITVP